MYSNRLSSASCTLKTCCLSHYELHSTSGKLPSWLPQRPSMHSKTPKIIPASKQTQTGAQIRGTVSTHSRIFLAYTLVRLALISTSLSLVHSPHLLILRSPEPSLSFIPTSIRVQLQLCDFGLAMPVKNLQKSSQLLCGLIYSSYPCSTNL